MSNNQVNIFEQASRHRVRFETVRGMVTVEDLWQAPLTSPKDGYNLDQIAIGLHEDLEATKVSFVSQVSNDPSGGRARTQLKFDLVKHIIEVKLEEQKARQDADKKAQKRAELLTLIEQKQTQELGSKSVDELKALLEAL